MAVFPCSECGGFVSELATRCPHCGCPANAIFKGKPEANPGGAGKGIRAFPKKNRYQHITGNRLKGLGGWLILVGIGLVLSPIFTLLSVVVLLGLFTDGLWEMISTPGTEFYVPFLGPLVVFELVFNSAVFLFSLFLLNLFFKKHYLFPKVLITFLVIHLVVLLLDTLITFELVGETTISTVVFSVIYAAIWIPYMLMSKRVKLTFVLGKEGSGEGMRRSFRR